jgi:TPR repeat protein
LLATGVVGLALALGLALVFDPAPMRQAAGRLAQTLALAAVTQDIDAGSAAYRKGDYASALPHVRPLADQGDARAQSILGLMYLNGRGVPKDDVAAATWFRRATDQGHAPAQFNLGVMYSEGHGVARDLNAHMWFSLAAERFYRLEPRSYELAVRNRNLIAAKMTNEEIALAQTLVRERSR